jgi:peptide/nickel transport system permease protein
MLQDCMDVQAAHYCPWLMAPVGLIVLTVPAFNFLGDGLRDAADPYS